MKASLRNLIAILALTLTVEQAQAVEFEPLGKAIAAVLGTTKAFKKSVKIGGNEVTVFYSKNDGTGKPMRLAFIEHGLYQPNCTHTWVIGADAATSRILEVRVNEMSCPHAFPTRAASYLDQYKGKSPADAARLDSQIDTIAKATGSCKLTTDAVKRTLTAIPQIRGQL